MKRSWIAVLVAFFILFLAAGCGKDKKDEGKAAMAQELSATIVSTSAGQKTTMKIYIKPDKYRTDMEAAGSSTIARKDINKVWIIMTQQKTYMEMPGSTNEQVKIAEEKVKGEVSRKKVGSETVDGHPTTKYEVTANIDGKVTQTYQWWATDINFPVKMAALDGSWSVEYRDVKIGSQPDSLFEVPPDYKKMTIPGMPADKKFKIPGQK